jgi:predicted nucleic acid-binding protein
MLELAATAMVFPISLDLILAWIQIRRRFQVSHWDATIIAAVVEKGCITLYSQDLNHGQSYDGVRVVNPFLNHSHPIEEQQQCPRSDGRDV